MAKKKSLNDIGKIVAVGFDVSGAIEAEVKIIDPKITASKLEMLLGSGKARMDKRTITMKRSGRVIGEVFFYDDDNVMAWNFYVDVIG